MNTTIPDDIMKAAEAMGRYIDALHARLSQRPHSAAVARNADIYIDFASGVEFEATNIREISVSLQHAIATALAASEARATKAEEERDALLTALEEIANAFTAHGYSNAMDAVQTLKDEAAHAIKRFKNADR